ncbi:AbrB-like transcriptional regulator [Cyanobium sp. Morenito 9A2]|uniref:AbrB-like transcriptional regulator n=1 Tax=Cyanobium sp. Morenito 9A2 TaxID=2823718 RepID=UPI0020CD6CA1|nr:AbrB-like transcriptional regulator [Cyanobium sp. Morenito 9A2]
MGYPTKLPFNGHWMAGKTHTSLMDLKPGNQCEIKLGRMQIHLLSLGATAEDGSGPTPGSCHGTVFLHAARWSETMWTGLNPSASHGLVHHFDRRGQLLYVCRRHLHP